MYRRDPSKIKKQRKRNNTSSLNPDNPCHVDPSHWVAEIAVFNYEIFLNIISYETMPTLD